MPQSTPTLNRPTSAAKPATPLVAALTASAFVLAGLLFTQLRPGLHTQAQASQLIEQEEYMFLTAKTDPDQEVLYALHKPSGTLLIYELDRRADSMILTRGRRLDQLFAEAASGRIGRGEDIAEGESEQVERRRNQLERLEDESRDRGEILEGGTGLRR